MHHVLIVRVHGIATRIVLVLYTVDTASIAVYLVVVTRRISTLRGGNLTIAAPWVPRSLIRAVPGVIRNSTTPAVLLIQVPHQAPDIDRLSPGSTYILMVRSVPTQPHSLRPALTINFDPP